MTRSFPCNPYGETFMAYLKEPRFSDETGGFVLRNDSLFTICLVKSEMFYKRLNVVDLYNPLIIIRNIFLIPTPIGQTLRVSKCTINQIQSSYRARS